MELFGWVVRQIQAQVVWFLSSGLWETLSRKVADLVGKRKGRILFFHCVSDPHSLLALEGVRKLVECYDVKVQVFVVPETSQVGLPAYATSEEEQFQWRLKDATLLQNLYPDLLESTRLTSVPTAEAIQLAQKILLCKADQVTFTANNLELLDSVIRVNQSVFEHDVNSLRKDSASLAVTEDHIRQTLHRNASKLKQEGHYLSAMFKYGFEWFWGLDRLVFLEQQLIEERRSLEAGRSPIFSRSVFTKCSKARKTVQSFQASASHPKQLANLPTLVLYYSFRSPYSQLILRPLFALAEFYGVQLDIRPVLPMVMRGLPVPFAKKLYIVRDAARLARILGFSHYGCLNDPVGKPVENAFAVYMEAKRVGKEREFLLAWSQQVYCFGTDALTESGLALICQDAGFKFSPALLQNTEWRQFAEKNREDMTRKGFWGVPVMSFGDLNVWGQDRLCVIESKIISLLSQK